MTAASFSRMRVRKRPPRGGLSGGPSRARTGDLLAASQTLSQLSYGPRQRRQCSPELELTRPSDPRFLVVSRRGEPKMKLTVREELSGGQQITVVRVRAIQGEGIELAGAVSPAAQALGPAAARVETRRDHVADSARPLALNAATAPAGGRRSG